MTSLQRICRIDYRGAALNGSRFAGRELLGCDFGGADIRAVNFSGSLLVACSFRNPRFVGTDFSHATIVDTSFLDCDFRNTRLTGAAFKGCRFHDVHLATADVHGSMWESCTFVRTASCSLLERGAARVLNCTQAFHDSAAAESARKRRPVVFLSYVRTDRKLAVRLRQQLEASGIHVLQDIDFLLPGRRWKDEIRRAIEGADFFLACFSHCYWSMSKTYMNEELLIAIEEMRLRSTETSWILPVVFTKCLVPERLIGPGETLRDLQRVDLHDSWEDGVALLVGVINSKNLGQD